MVTGPWLWSLLMTVRHYVWDHPTLLSAHHDNPSHPIPFLLTREPTVPNYSHLKIGKIEFWKKILFCRRVSVSISLTSNQNFSTNFLPNWLKFSQCVRCGVCDRYGITLHVTHHTSHVTNNWKTVPDPLCDKICKIC